MQAVDPRFLAPKFSRPNMFFHECQKFGVISKTLYFLLSLVYRGLDGELSHQGSVLVHLLECRIHTHLAKCALKK